MRKQKTNVAWGIPSSAYNGPNDDSLTLKCQWTRRQPVCLIHYVFGWLCMCVLHTYVCMYWHSSVHTLGTQWRKFNLPQHRSQQCVRTSLSPSPSQMDTGTQSTHMYIHMFTYIHICIKYWLFSCIAWWHV